MACKPWRSYLLGFDGWCKLRILCPCKAKLRISQIPFRIWTKTYTRIYVPSIKSIHAVRKPVEECFKKRRFWRTPYMIVCSRKSHNQGGSSRVRPPCLQDLITPLPPTLTVHCYSYTLACVLHVFAFYLLDPSILVSIWVQTTINCLGLTRMLPKKRLRRPTRKWYELWVQYTTTYWPQPWQALKWHPDRNGGSEAASKKFKEVRTFFW